MNVKIVLAVVFAMGIGSEALAYTVKVKNATPYPVDINIHYAGASAIACKQDNFQLLPGTEHSQSTGLCLLTSIDANVLLERRGSSYQGTGETFAKGEVAAKYRSTGRGSAEYIVFGPVSGNKYGVTRYCNEKGSLSH